MRASNALLLSCVALAALAPNGTAHFRLMEPASELQENRLGDPRKPGSCGGTSGRSGEAQWLDNQRPGQRKTPHQIQETNFHVGFYCVALAVNPRDELPKDAEAKTEPTANGPRSVSAAIQYPPLPPVLADGMFQHVAKFDKEQETDVEIPDINCKNCILQVVEFTANHE
jgi:hypothetical protein